MVTQLTLDLDPPAVQGVAAPADFICVKCEAVYAWRPPGRNCSGCGGYVIAAAAWLEPDWLDTFTGDSDA